MSPRAGAARPPTRRSGTPATVPPSAVARSTGFNERHGESLARGRVHSMRFVVVGAGAIGGAVGARLFQRGYDVTLVARGDHGRALAVRPRPRERPTRPSPCPSPSSPSRRRCRGPPTRTVIPSCCWPSRASTPTTPSPSSSVAPPSAPGRLHAERRGERAPCPAPLLQHLRHVRDVPCHASCGPGSSRCTRPRSPGCSTSGRFPSGLDDRGQAIADAIATTTLPVGGPPRHHALEVPQAPHEPGQRGRGAERARGSLQRAGARGAAGGQGGARRGGHRRGELRGGP